jgi:hypothetical protein
LFWKKSGGVSVIWSGLRVLLPIGILTRYEAVNEELTELTNEQGKLHADIKQMKISMDGDRHESKITAFASAAMRFTERADDYETKIDRLQENLPVLWRED